MALLALISTSAVRAQATLRPDQGSSDAQASTGEVSDVQVQIPTSTEQGQTLIDESFGRISHSQWIAETRREAFRDTKYSAELRSFCLHSDNLNGTESAACALGGSAGFKTGYFREHFAFGATGYTSQRLYGPEDKDGTRLLAPGQQGYTVIGEAYAAILLSERIQATVGRKTYDTPYINPDDSRMTPNTFEAAVVQGAVGGINGAPAWRFGVGYVDKIKERNSEEFVSMAAAADAPAGISRGVSAAGAKYSWGELSVGAFDYYSTDIINIAYVEAKDVFALSHNVRLRVGSQYAEQRDIGDDLLTGHAFSAHQLGFKIELDYAGALLTAAYTTTSNGTSMQSPWGGYPGYTKAQIGDFNRGGEDAWMLRAAYKFKRLRSLSAYALYVRGSKPDVAMQYAQEEYDLNLEWKLSSGKSRGLKLRARFGHLSDAGPGAPHANQLRLILNYDPL